MTPLILASTSPYRYELLSRLGLSFAAQKPLFNEDKAKTTALSPKDLCQFLGREKARSLSNSHNCVIGGDQMVLFEGKILGKPGSQDQAIKQLLAMQNKIHELLTSVSVFAKGHERSFLDVTSLKMRPLSPEEIKTYVALDNPIDCAGSYKIEKHGIALFEKIQTEDFTAIQGLPLLKLTQVLLEFGYKIPEKTSEKKT